MSGGAEQEDEDSIVQSARDKPMHERLAHKHWKVRLEAYKQVAEAGAYADSLKEPPIKEFAPVVSKAACDTNVNALDSALDAIVATLRAAEEGFASKHALSLSESLVTKGLCAKPTAVPKATEALMLLVELDCPQAVIEALTKGSSARSPRAAAAALDALHKVIASFGTSVLDTKTMVKALPPLFDNKDKNVREKAKSVTVELAMWLGNNVVEKALLQKVRENQKREVEEMLSGVEAGSKRPSRFLRKHACMQHDQEQDANGDSTTEMNEQQSTAQHADAEELIEPTEILPKLNHARGDDRSFWDAIESQKWKERHEALTYLRSLTSAEKIADGDYHHLSSTLKKIIQKDANVACVTEACHALAGLVNGLGSHFRDARMVTPHLFPKLKEKKESVCNAVLAALRALTNNCIGLPDLADEITEALNHKTPKVQMLTMSFLGDQVPKAGKQQAAKLHKDVLPACLKGLEHSSPEVRDAAVKAILGFCKAANGTGPIAKHISTVEEAKKKKLEEALASELGMGPKAQQQKQPASHQPSQSGAQQSATATGDSNMPRERQKHRDDAPTQAASHLEAARPHDSKLQPPDPTMKRVPQRPAHASSLSQGRGTARVTKRAATSTKSKEGPDGVSDDVSAGHVPSEELEQRLDTIFGHSTAERLKSSNWKERLAAVEEMYSAIDEACSKEATDCVIRAIGNAPGWSEKNIQIVQKLVKLVGKIALASDGFDKRHAKLIMSGMTYKIGDMKLKQDVISALTSIAQVIGPQFVLIQLVSHAKVEKNPKVLAESLTWTCHALEQFGIGHFEFNKCIAPAREALDSSNPNIKQSAIKVWGELHRQLGDDIKRFVSDVKPALQTSLEAEFARKPYEGVQPPQLEVSGVDSEEISTTATDVIPRQDISERIDSSTISNLSSTRWQERQAALEAVESVLNQAGSKISGVPNDLVKELRGRLQDSHKNLVAYALNLLGQLASALGTSADKKLKPALSDITRCLSDGKKQVREAALKCLDATNAAMGTSRCLPLVCEHLANGKLVTTAEGKKDGISWVCDKVADGKSCDVEPNCFVQLAAVALADKTTEARSAASNLVQALASTYDHQLLRRNDQVPAAYEKAFTSCLQRFTTQSVANKDSVNESDRQKDHKAASTSNVNDTSVQRSSSQKQTRLTSTDVKSSEVHARLASSNPQQGNLSPMQPSSNKDSRLQKLPKKPMAFEDVLPLAVGNTEELQKELGPLCRPDIREALFSTDFKQHMKAADEIEHMLGEELHVVVLNFDLLLRWIALRLSESQPNTQSMLRVITLTQAILAAMTEGKYRINEEEVAILAPALVEKSGHNLDKIRQGVRKLISELYYVFPVSKIVPFLIEGAKHKNTRTRSECMEEIGMLLQRHGIATCNAGHNRGVIPVLVRQVGERDSQTRTAALNALTACYKAEGDRIWQSINPNSHEAKALKEKLKWLQKESQENLHSDDVVSGNATRRKLDHKERMPLGQRQVQQSQDNGSLARAANGKPGSGYQQQQDNCDIQEAEQHGSPTAAKPLSNSTSFTSKSPAPKRQLSLRQLQEMVMEENLDDPGVDMLKQMYNKLTELADAGDSVLEEGVDPDELAVLLIDRLEAFFHRDVINFDGQHFQARPLKYAMHCLMIMSERKETATLSRQNLKRIYGLLISFLNQPKLRTVPEGTQIWQALNIMSLKFLQNGSKTATACTLLEMLREENSSSESIVKCLVKVTKTLPASLDELVADEVLIEIHKCFEYYRQEVSDGEPQHRPFRMIKTLLYQLCRSLPSEIEGRISAIPLVAETSDPWICQYTRLNLTALGQNIRMNDASANAAADVTAYLSKLIDDVRSRDDCDNSISELIDIDQMRPKLHIPQQLRQEEDVRNKIMQHVAWKNDRASSAFLQKLRNEADAQKGEEEQSGGVKCRQNNSTDTGGMSPNGHSSVAKDRTSLESLKERMRQIEEEKDKALNYGERGGGVVRRPNTSGGETEMTQDGAEARSDRRARVSVSDLQARLREIEQSKQPSQSQ